MPLTPVAVKLTLDPADRPAVLLQLEHGWVTLLPGDARRVAVMLLDAADELDPQRQA